jgi:hypothetical protein
MPEILNTQNELYKDPIKERTQDDYIEPQQIWDNVSKAEGTPQDSANNRKTFVQDDAPTKGYQEGDFWIKTNDDNHLYTANASLEWVSARDGTIFSGAWDDITGAGKPADNATVGATVGTDLVDSGDDVLGDDDVKNFLEYEMGEDGSEGDVVYLYDSKFYLGSTNHDFVRLKQLVGILYDDYLEGATGKAQFSGLKVGGFSFAAANQYLPHYLQDATINNIEDFTGYGGTAANLALNGSGHRVAQIMSSIASGTIIDRVGFIPIIGVGESLTCYAILQGTTGNPTEPDNNNLAISNSRTFTNADSGTTVYLEFPFPYETVSSGNFAIVLVWEASSGTPSISNINNAPSGGPDNDVNTHSARTTDGGTNWTVNTLEDARMRYDYYTNKGQIGTSAGSTSKKVGKAFGSSNMFLTSPADN